MSVANYHLLVPSVATCHRVAYWVYVAETELMIIGSRQRLTAQCDDVEIRIEKNYQIPNYQESRSYQILKSSHRCSTPLGKHVEEICKEVSSAIGALKRVRPLIFKDTAIQIYNSIIMPHFDYYIPVWDCLSGYSSDKLKKLQNCAARVITKTPFDTSSTNLFSTLNWKRLSLRQKKQKALMMYTPWMTLLRNIYNVISLRVTLLTT